MTLGILIPEFPGQTHIFYLRQLEALEKLGIVAEVVSTRRPIDLVNIHTTRTKWLQGAQYLLPPSGGAVVQTLLELLKSGPKKWLKYIRIVFAMRGIPWRERIRILGFSLPGAHIAWLARKKGWNHLHVHSCANSAFIALAAHILFGVRYSLTLHGPLDDYGPVQREKWKHAEFAIVITQLLKKEVRKKLGKDVPKLLEVAPMGVDIENWKRTVPYQPWQGIGSFWIVSCGRLHPAKGHHWLIKATDELVSRGINAKLRILGEDNTGSGYRHELEKLIDQRNLSKRIELLGAVDELRVKKELESCSVFSLASKSEPLGVAIMEAMAMAVPVVVTEAGGVAELVAPEQEGILVEAESATKLAVALERIARNPDLALQFGVRGRVKVQKEFHIHRSAATLRQCLRKISISKKSSRGHSLKENA